MQKYKLDWVLGWVFGMRGTSFEFTDKRLPLVFDLIDGLKSIILDLQSPASYCPNSDPASVLV